jgi:rubrerythrin
MARLEQEPRAQARTVPELMSLAAAMEREAVRRYAQLAAEMVRRGDHGLAATFHAMEEEERDHLDGIERWSRALTGMPPHEEAQPWELPPEIARSWDEAAGSARLTPYRALSIAVLNEERGFAFYTYLAANAEDEAVRETATRLAAEELSHAALLRRERRRAWRRERGAEPVPVAHPTTEAEFADRRQRIERTVAQKLASIAVRLRALGCDADAAALEAAAGKEPRPLLAPLDVDKAPYRQSRMELLRAATAEAEQSYDVYADLADHAGTEAVLRQAQQAAAAAVRRLAAIAARLHAAEPGVSS